MLSELSADTLAAQYVTNGTSSTGSNASAPGNAISGGYSGGSLTVKGTIIFFSGLSMYNVVELIILIFFTFQKFSGLYFYSLLVTSICVLPYSLGFMLKFLMITPGGSRWFAVTLITIGWWGMVTGQSIVLWSRLHLLVDPGEKGQWTLRWTMWMIIIDAICLHIPTTVLTYGSNGDINTGTFVTGYNVMEKIQMCGFFIQELILSVLYIKQASKLVQHSTRDDSRRFFMQLLGINVLIILMDVGLVAAEAASLYLYETTIKGTVYSIKLKLEFAVLGKLVNFAGGRAGTSTANEERYRRASVAFVGDQTDDGSGSSETRGVSTGFNDVTDFVDLSKVKSSISHASGASNRSLSRTTTNGLGDEFGRQRRKTIKTGRGVTNADIDLARFEYLDDAELPEELVSEDVDAAEVAKEDADTEELSTEDEDEDELDDENEKIEDAESHGTHARIIASAGGFPITSALSRTVTEV